MTDYYSILGLNKNATDIEIKAAFRKLAKIYHPDKNPNDPNAKYLFENILMAYNTLINHHSRRRYDNLNAAPRAHHTQPVQPQKRGQKEWTTTEEDLKRRDYYKKYYQAKKQNINTTQEKAPYSDYKYILFATPIAVGLLMLIVSFFNSEPKVSTNSKSPTEHLPEITAPAKLLINGYKPYSGHFGNLKLYDTEHSIQINNSTNFDAVIAVFDKQTNAYLQHAYLQASYNIEFLKLPATGVYWKCMLGKSWATDKVLANEKICGAFDSIVQYQNWKKTPIKFNNDGVKELILLQVINVDSKNKEYISNDIEFFEK